MKQKNKIIPKIVLFLSSSITLNIVQMIQQRGVLAGVVITPRVDTDSRNLEYQINQMKISSFRYDGQDISKTISNIKQLKGNIGLVVTFSVKFPQEIIESLEYGIFNTHASLLPQYKGTSPIFWQLKNNERKTAVVIHKVKESIDSGDIAVTYKFDIHLYDTFGTLSASIFQIIPILINEFLELLSKYNGDIPLTKQEGIESNAPTPSQNDITVDWKTMSAKEIVSLAKACNPNFGGAQILYKNSYIGIMEAKLLNTPSYGLDPGTIIHIGAPEGLIVATKEGSLKIETFYLTDGVFSGLVFADRFSLDAGEKFN